MFPPMSTVLTRPPSSFHRSHVPRRRRGWIEPARKFLQLDDEMTEPAIVNPTPVVLSPQSRSSPARGVEWGWIEPARKFLQLDDEMIEPSIVNPTPVVLSPRSRSSPARGVEGPAAIF